LTPGSKNGLMLDGSAEQLREAERKQLHMTMAQVLYVSKRAWPDIILFFFCVPGLRRLQPRIK
jgi:hypothetical protein